MYRDFLTSGMHSTNGSAPRSMPMNKYGVSLLGVTTAVSFGGYTREYFIDKPFVRV